MLEAVDHDPSAFTQGLVLAEKDGLTTLYEGTGLYSKSSIRIVDLPTGKVRKQTDLDPQFFGEGVAYYEDQEGNGRLVQLTWKSQLAFIYDSSTLEKLDQFKFTTENDEGWGITLRATPKNGDGVSLNYTHFVVSDGSSYLHRWDSNWDEVGERVKVHTKKSDNGRAKAVDQINELEWDPATDTILANVWKTDTILRINPDSGLVEAQYDLSELYPNKPATSNVLNGIARVPGSLDEFWLTGKLWPVMFRVRLI